MKPVSVSVDVPQAIDDVFEFLDVMANHEPFTDHLLKDWEYSGPERGIGSKARVHITVAGRTEPVDIEVTSATRPTQIVEHNVSAGGRRHGTGTYNLAPTAAGGTHVEFVYSWQQVPAIERLTGPLMRAMVRRGNQRAMQRLAGMLAERAQA